MLFYSNDQDFHKLIIDYYIPVEGIHLNAFFGLRYILTIPVYLIAKLGFDAMLLLKAASTCGRMVLPVSRWVCFCASVNCGPAGAAKLNGASDAVAANEATQYAIKKNSFIVLGFLVYNFNF